MPAKAGCACTPDTPVPLLCHNCLDKRRRIRDRLNRRKARAAARGQEPRPTGTAALPPDTVSTLVDALDSIDDLLIQANDPVRTLSPLEQQLVYNLGHLHQVLRDALQPAAEELVEMGRDTSQYRNVYESKKPRFATEE